MCKSSKVSLLRVVSLLMGKSQKLRADDRRDVTYLGVSNTVDGWRHDVFRELTDHYRAVVSSC